MSDDIDQRCMVHEDRPMVCRISAVSVSDTPVIKDCCRECAELEIDGYAMNGLHPDVEIEWFAECDELQSKFEAIEPAGGRR